MIIPVQEVCILPGSNITDVATEVYEYAKKHNCIVRFKFNDVELEVFPNSLTPQQIVEEYFRKLRG